MIREKIILSVFVMIISFVFIEITVGFSSNFKINTFEKNISKSVINNFKEKAKKTIPPFLNITGWGNDVFYDRSDIYDNWFTLTGIIQFENGQKVIINDKILQINERVRGFSVDKITDNKVELTRNNYRVTLNLEK